MQILSNFEFFSISHLLRSSMAEAEEVNNTETFIQAFETVPKISIKNAKQMKRQFNNILEEKNIGLETRVKSV